MVWSVRNHTELGGHWDNQCLISENIPECRGLYWTHCLLMLMYIDNRRVRVNDGGGWEMLRQENPWYSKVIWPSDRTYPVRETVIKITVYSSDCNSDVPAGHLWYLSFLGLLCLFLHVSLCFNASVKLCDVSAHKRCYINKMTYLC